jgi:phage/plasmid-like protein (TIGR03299 family)
MAHELTFRNGEAEAFYVQEPAWHRHGTVLDNPPDLDTAFQLAGLDFTVEKVPVEYRLADGQLRESKLAYVTVRTDTYQELGAVGAAYTPLQNVDAFRAIEPLLDSGVLQLECGGSLREGADCWLLGKFDMSKFGPVVQEVFGDEVVPYVSFKSNHSGRRKNSVSLTPIREVCANTLTLSERLGNAGEIPEIKISHRGDALQRTIEATEALLGGVIDRYEVVANHFRDLKATVLSDEQFKTLVLDAVSPDPRENPKFNPEAKQADWVIGRHEKRVNEVSRLWEGGKGNTGDHSAWEAWNGAVQAIDHNTDVFPINGGAWQRGQSLMDGALRDKKVLVLNNLLDLVVEETKEQEKRDAFNAVLEATAARH